MTAQEKIIAIAELDGWVFCETRITSPSGDYRTHKYWVGYWVGRMPPYLTSRDAIIPVICKTLGSDRNKWRLFLNQVGKQIEHDPKDLMECHIAEYNMSAEQLCEALLGATGKLKG